MIDNDYRYVQDAPQKGRSAILHGSGGQHPTAQPNQYATPLQHTLYCAALAEKQQRPHLLVDPHQAQQAYAAQSKDWYGARKSYLFVTPHLTGPGAQILSRPSSHDGVRRLAHQPKHRQLAG